MTDAKCKGDSGGEDRRVSTRQGRQKHGSSASPRCTKTKLGLDAQVLCAVTAVYFIESNRLHEAAEVTCWRWIPSNNCNVDRETLSGTADGDGMCQSSEHCSRPLSQ